MDILKEIELKLEQLEENLGRNRFYLKQISEVIND